MRYCKHQAIPCDLATKDGYCQITVCVKERYKPRHRHDDHQSGLIKIIKSQKNTSPKN